NKETHNRMNALKYMGQSESIRMDQLLMGQQYGFSVDQLMELAGLSVAASVQKCYGSLARSPKRVLAICGPGNNGGDGLVASRHLVHFGYAVDVLYPKRTDKDLYKNLVLQCQHVGISFLDNMPAESELTSRYGLVIDSIFGYSFKGDIRAPFDSIIKTLTGLNSQSLPIASVDIPSGWDVEQGNVNNTFTPSLLISLAAPKKCAESFKGTHYLGGRFLPQSFLDEFQLNLPQYPGAEQCVDISLQPSSS
ncbi:hypothetical protein SAMD00019534_010340, partial [Acytostelium subglobosum LB1]|uniref:hypothetical protein n=1 Tax=Acytostelium subglobosum LB1 TaxID=1410327 RepID=UPI0006449229